MRALLALVLLAAAAYAMQAVVVKLDGTIDGTAVTLVERGLEAAEARGLPLVLVIDTPGGFLLPMEKIVKLVESARVPVYAYVPDAARAASAGAFIALAAERLYMAPTAVIGAAQPRPPDPKVVNYAAAKMRALAARRWNDTRVQLAESFVTENKALTGAEAVAAGIAEPPPPIEPAAVVERDPLLRLLNALSDPALLVAMLIAGAALILYEVATSGFQGLGVIGGVAVVSALYLLGELGISWLAAALALAAAVLIIAEAHLGHGAAALAGAALGAAAVVAAYWGQPYVGLSALGATAAGLSIAAGIALAYVAWRVRRSLSRRPQSLRDVVGARGVAKTALGPGRRGVVYAAGEDWTAESVEGEVQPGEEVEVVDVEGLVLKVKKVK
ncbi:NfeD family protein [Pyrobaculum neutrophilum]|uniref:Uncharacterized protein n=1 Tax=Pyrobaculum neutrophilum (strain DSM 2338 / JCM 9278 / NBRC 100436 / V24Sta) TaxID=444157 RepID=B1YBC8_PYRNV|nr:NfeD family protein [Pyrobaculum neutrophilum]ACB39259.1 protein of unknown function DUF107 [Pyrobaculum neutrophilum V24Sta]